jgi:RNA-directed DNA polymerase
LIHKQRKQEQTFRDIFLNAMKIKEDQSRYLKNAFSKIHSKEDLLELLNYTKEIIYNKKSYPFKLIQLTYHSNPRANKKRYFHFSIRKKSGGERIIYSPNKGLKEIQICLNLIFQTIYDVHHNAHGFVPKRSIINNAKAHTGMLYVYNIDLKDFFPSIDQARIWGRLQHPPFNLNIKNKRIEIANIIASLCCHEMEVERLDDKGQWQTEIRNVLPQGAPTSPTLSNIICQQLDFYLSAVAKRFGLNYTRYADDITFSSMHNVYQKEGEFIKEVNRIITSQNFNIKVTKTRLQKQGYRKEVTGLLVNEKVNVQKRYIKQLRMWLYFWEIYGYEKTNTYFLPQYLEDKCNIKHGEPNFANIIRGKLNYLKMVKGADNDMYITLRKRFDILINNKSKVPDPTATVTSQAIESQTLPSSEKKLKKPIDKPIQHFTLPILHNPKEVVTILKNFSTNNSALKYSTHSWNAGIDKGLFEGLEDFLKKAKREFNKISRPLKKLNRRFYSKINSFLFYDKVGLKGWGIHRVKFGWSSPELLERWKQEIQINSNKKPEDIVISEEAQFQLKTPRGVELIQKFKQVIDIFKNEIEIRDEFPVLEDLILEFHDKYLREFVIKDPESLKTLKNKTFYTDVDYLRKALDLVFENIQKRPYHREVSYSVENKIDSLTIMILQYNSFNKGKSIYDEKLSLKKGDLSTLKDRLFNLCDWSIESEFMEGLYRINYLVSDPSVPNFVKLESADGFKHLFTFYK